MRWTVCQDFALQVRVLDKETVVFHHGSGETHRLNNDAAAVLRLLREHNAPMNETQLLSYFQQTESSGIYQESIAVVLRELQNLQIIETV